MKTERIELENYLQPKFTKIALDENKSREIYSALKEQYDIPTGYTMDIIAERQNLTSVPLHVLFDLLEAINHTKLDKFFTEIEIENFRKIKYDAPERVKFPIRIKCLQVSSDQWIAATTASFLMKLYRSQLIIYNVNTQRVMKKIGKGVNATYKIELNKKAVKEISSSYKEGNYIANTITLNINEESDADYYYDEDSMELIIKSIKGFDIIDGYHRLIAMSQTMNECGDFDYPMELRIVTFSEDKAKQFIYQEDQKTKMTKVASESMNMGSDANFIVEKLNSSIDSNLKGTINRNAGIINFGDMAAIINRVYYTGRQIADRKTHRLIVTKELKFKLNAITDDYPEILSSPISMKKLYGLIVLCSMQDATKLIHAAGIILNNNEIDKLDIKTIQSARSLKIITNYVEEVSK